VLAKGKLLKAFLTYPTVECEKSHALLSWVDLCVPVDESCSELYPIAQNLTVYAVGIRYPEFVEPTIDEAQAALNMAHQAWDFVLHRIPTSLYP
jgi:hypothetical protein